MDKYSIMHSMKSCGFVLSSLLQTDCCSGFSAVVFFQCPWKIH